MFKKRQVKKDTIRRSRAVEDENEEEASAGAGEAEQLELLREMRSEQKDRRRAAGVDINKLMSASEQAVKEKERKIEEEARGLQQQESGPDLKALMTNQFTEQVGLLQADDKVHEKRMEDFIDEKMGVVKDRDAVVENKATSKAKSEEDQLYHIEDVAKNENQIDESISGNAAPLFMNTGLAEVALPVDFRLRNIERTAEAKAGVQARRDGVFQRRDSRRSEAKPNSVEVDTAASSGRYGGSAALSGGSFNSNFNVHRREWAVMMQSKEGGGHSEMGEKGGGGGGGGQSREQFDGTCNNCGKTGHRSRDCQASRGGGGGRGGGSGAAGGGKGSGGKGGGGGEGGQRRGGGSSSDDRVFEQYKKKARR